MSISFSTDADQYNTNPTPTQQSRQRNPPMIDRTTNVQTHSTTRKKTTAVDGDSRPGPMGRSSQNEASGQLGDSMQVQNAIMGQQGTQGQQERQRQRQHMMAMAHRGPDIDHMSATGIHGRFDDHHAVDRSKVYKCMYTTQNVFLPSLSLQYICTTP